MKLVLMILLWGLIAAGIIWFIIKQKQKNALQKKQTAERKEKERLKLIEVYGEVNGMAIFNKKIHQGFDQQMVIYAWGYAADKKEKVNLGKVKERWFFGEYKTDRGTVKYTQYVDFENGIVIGWGDVTK